MTGNRTGIRLTQLACVLGVLALAGIYTADRLTWALETFPVMIAVPLLWGTYKRFLLTPMLYWIITVHALVLIAGGYWTYAHVPLGFWIEHAFGLSRNPYDKIGHFLQGVTPALLTREILLRRGYLRAKGMTAFLAICVAALVSMCYELLEWGCALALGQGADEFLGTQGDPWDTQSDMFMALIGASVAMGLLSRWQDRQMQALGSP